jgi:hypothetical protein
VKQSPTFAERGGQVAGNPGGHGAKLGSWIACLVILAGFVVGGVALIVWNWPLFWIGGVGVIVAGCVFARAVNIMEDVTEYGGHGPAGDPEPST